MEPRNIVLPEKVNGHRKAPNGVYVPGSGMIRRILEKHKPRGKKYLEQEGELQRIKIAQVLKRAVLLAGPTGSGKSLLAQEFARSREMPFIHTLATEDTTDAKLRGYISPLSIPIEVGGKFFNAEAMALVPSAFSVGAMSKEPVVIYLDELHKLRKGVTSLLHPIANKSERMLPMFEFTGETYALHQDSALICALNPDVQYGDGFSQLDPALRRRFTTIYLGLPDTEEKYGGIVDMNLEGASETTPSNWQHEKAELETDYLKGRKAPRKYEKVKKRLIGAVLALNRSMDSYKRARESGANSSGEIDPSLKTDEIDELKEKISPDSVIAALEFIWMGVEPNIAVRENIVHAIVEDFGSAATALESYFEKKGVW